ncbi:MAG TPA: hypothetical protein VFQ07_08265 [Candidatus Polarisedimenticolia bacterium]|nr:hypothetical protein [Candidatus Polarisedimenticolia bacterium]
MLETPEQPSYAAELALIAGFLLLLAFEAAFVPADGWNLLRLVAGAPAPPAATGATAATPTPVATQQAAQGMPPPPIPAP